MCINHAELPTHTVITAHKQGHALSISPTPPHADTGARPRGEGAAEQRPRLCKRGTEALGADRSRKQDEGSPLH